MDKSAQILFAEDRGLRALRAHGQARYAEVHADTQSDRAVGRYLTSAAELVKAAEALYQADEDTRNRRTREGLRELAANAPELPRHWLAETEGQP